MNGRERMLAAARRGAVDRVAVLPQVFGHAAALSGVGLGDYLRDGRSIARCQLAAWRHYGYDGVFGFLDAAVETEAVGAEVTFHANRYPEVAVYPLEDGGALAGLRVPDPATAGRMPQALAALSILRAEAGDRALVVGCVQGPLTLAAQLAGLQRALLMAVDDPPAFAALLDFARDVAIRYGVAQIAAGADLPLVFEPVGSPIVFPPRLFTGLALPRLRQLFRALAEAGAATNWLHIAGRTAAILPSYSAAGVEMANVDYCVDMAEARRLSPDICLTGNIKPVAMLEEPPAEIRRQARAVIRAMAGRPGFVLSTGCEVPPESPPEAVAALVEAARRPDEDD